MSDPINFESAARRHQTCDIALNEGETIQGEPIQGETNIGQANTCQAGGWGLAPVPLAGTHGARALPATATLNDRSDSVCKPEVNPLPPVCVADDEAAAADAAKARGETLHCPTNREMPPCPGAWDDTIPVGWKRYEGVPSFFHCSFRGMVGDCSPDSDHLQQECFYNEAGQLVKNVEYVRPGDFVDIDYRCAGTPNADDAEKNPIRHFFSAGGIIQEGWPGLLGTIFHDDREQHETENETDPPDIQ
jgi:hypothetical protein